MKLNLYFRGSPRQTNPAFLRALPSPALQQVRCLGLVLSSLPVDDTIVGFLRNSSGLGHSESFLGLEVGFLLWLDASGQILLDNFSWKESQFALVFIHVSWI